MLTRIFHKVKVYTVSETISKGLNWSLFLVLPLIMPTETFGLVALLVAFENFLLPILLGGQNTAILRFYYKFKNHEGYFNNSVITNLKFWIIAVVPIVLVSIFIFQVDIGYALIVLLIPFLGFRELVLTLLRVKENLKNYSKIRITFQAVKFISVITLALLIDNNAITYPIGLGIATFFSILQIFYSRKEILYEKRTNIRLKRHLFWFGLPIVFHTISGAIMSYFDRYMIDYFLDKSSVAIYSFAYSISFSLFFFMAIGSLIFQPYYFKFNTVSRESENALRIYTNLVFLAVSFLAIILYWSYDYILNYYPPSYHKSTVVFSVLLITLVISPLYQQGNLRLTLQNKTRLLPWMTLISAAINVVLNLIFIPKWNVEGAAYATLLSTGALVILVNYISGVKKRELVKIMIIVICMQIGVIYPEYFYLFLISIIFSFTDLIIQKSLFIKRIN